ncbi:MAG: ribonuclease HI [Chloroflexi bacterium]|nr:ribonuclease HI [Chloroflexota bacterium]
MSDDQVVIYSDGGSDPNPGIGGWAAILKFGEHERVLTGNNLQATNNRMELQAAIEALRVLKRPCQVEFHTDSQYLRKGITKWIEGWAAKGWRSSTGKPIQNVDLWKLLQPLVKQHDINWHWVKGHAGDPMNERVDRLARQARLEITPAEIIDETVPKLYVRSSCKGNPGPGGWGVVLAEGDDTQQSSGSAVTTTNNRMEITAAIEGLLLLPPGSSVQLFTTSDYLYQGITKWIFGWRKREWQKRDGKPVANGDLWKALDQLTTQYAVKWINAKGKEIPALDDAGKLATSAVNIA